MIYKIAAHSDVGIVKKTTGASGADGFCSTYFWVASGEAATAFFSCSRLMWV